MTDDWQKVVSKRGVRRAVTLCVNLLLALGTVLGSAATAAAQDGGAEGIPIDIKGGIRRALIPMAIPPVKSMGGGDPKVAREITRILQRDLMISGYFRVLPEDSFFFDLNADGLSPSTINFQNWFNVGAAGLIKGGYKEAAGQVKLDLRLFVVDKGEQVRLEWRPEAVGKNEIRRSVHEFANAVIEYYTGHRGIFGTQIAFAAKTKGGQKHIYVMDMDGANLRRITKNDSINLLPRWGAGGVYYTSYQDGNPDLFVFKGGATQKVSSQPGQNSGAAMCKGRMAVTLSKGGTNTDIYLVHPMTGAIQSRLTDHWGIDTSPTWSPDCSRIAFVSDRAGGPQIYVMNADGSGQKRLTFAGTYNTSPDWSPKGDVIAFTARDERGAFDIFSVDTSGYIERLTQNQGSNEDPSFSPDGNYIVFTSSRGGSGPRIYIMTADGEVQNLITRQGSGYGTPAWSR